MTTVTYDIATGAKSDFYTLWKTVHVDLRPRDAEGNITENYRMNSIGGNMYYHVHIKFVQNLSKTKEGAILKLQELGVDLPDSAFDFDLKHYTKPSFEAFGVKMKFKNDKWYAPATQEFWKCWKENKDDMKSFGWSCWNYKGDWFMAVRTPEN